LVAGSAAAAAATFLGSQAIAQRRGRGEGAPERELGRGQGEQAQAGAQVTTNPADKLRIRAASPSRRWYTLNFPTVQAAVNYANLPPAQGPGEFMITDRSGEGSGYDVCIYM
jgi:hypothetical protein